MTPETSGRTALIYSAAVISGVAALIYQVVWIKMLALSFGSTTEAAASVIGSFMLGMGLGARLYTVVERRTKSAFKLYGVLELGIAASTMLLSSVLYGLTLTSTKLLSSLTGTLPEFVLRILVLQVLLLLPCALMGATFPALCRAAIKSYEGLRRHVGHIYGLNTIGAAFGALLAGFALIDLLGHRGSVWIANTCNVLAAAVAFFLSRREAKPSLIVSGQSSPARRASSASLPFALLAATVIISGFTTMAYEIIWFRAIGYLVGNGTYAISLVLAIFLAGLGLGATWHRRIVRRKSPAEYLAVSQAMIAFLALGAMGLETFMLTHEPLWQQISIFAQTVALRPWPEQLAIVCGVSVAILLPPTVFMGLVFPLTCTLYVRQIDTLGERLGTVYLLANVGSILGVLAGGLIILPALGTMGATRLLSSINLLLALVLYLSMRRRGAGMAWRTITPIMAGIVLLVILPGQLRFKGELDRASSSRVLFSEEGEYATVKVVTVRPPNQKGMTIDGFIIGVDREWKQDVSHKQLLLAHLPMALQPDIRHSLNIGLGTGTTLASLAAYEQIETLDCVEISRAVLNGVQFFKDGSVLEDPRVVVHIDDAVHFLLKQACQYDLIISDGKQNPRFQGNSALLSREFFEMARERLTPGGIFVQWIPLGYPTEAFGVVLRTFLSVFAESDAYYFTPAAVILIGSNSPLPRTTYFDSSHFAVPRAYEDLSPYKLLSPSQLMAARVADGNGLAEEVEDAVINTWDHPVLEFLLFRDFRIASQRGDQFRNVQLLLRAGREDEAPSEDQERAIRAMQWLQLGFAELLRTGDPESFRPLCLRALAANPNDPLAHALLKKVDKGYFALMGAAF